MDPNTICIYNISKIPLDSLQQQSCELYVTFMQYFNIYANFIIVLLCLAILLITLFGGFHENFMWFVFHYALLYFVFFLLNIIFDLLFYIIHSTEFDLFMNFLHTYFLNPLHDLALVSGLPIAFNRFFQMYFPDHYEEFFHKKSSLFWCLGYDILVVGLNFAMPFVSHSVSSSFIVSLISQIALNLFLMFSMILMTIFILLKIRKNLKLLKENMGQKSTLKEIRRAAIACLIQALLVLINMSINVAATIIRSKVQSDNESRHIFVSLLILIIPLGDVFYGFAVIIDTLIFLLILRSYRNVILRSYKMVLKKIFKSNNAETTTVRVVESRNNQQTQTVL